MRWPGKNCWTILADVSFFSTNLVAKNFSSVFSSFMVVTMLFTVIPLLVRCCVALPGKSPLLISMQANVASISMVVCSLADQGLSTRSLLHKRYYRKINVLGLVNIKKRDEIS